MKHLFKLTATLLLLSMMVSMLPAAVLPVHAEGNEIPVGNAEDGVRTAVDGANDGDIILITDRGHVNDTNSDAAPWVIDKNVTIRGAGDHNTLNIRAGGIILNADVTFENIKLALPNPARMVIMANGHTLTMDNVIRDESVLNGKIDLACGGLVNSKFASTPGAHGQIIVRNCTGLDDVYAGNVSDTAEGSTFDGAATVVIEADSDKTRCVKTLYGQGQQGGAVTGPVKFSFYHNTAAAVDGATGGSQNAAVAYSGEQNLNDTLVLQNISSFAMGSGNLTLASGSDINGADLTVANGSTFRFTNLANPSVSNFTGGGLLVLGQSQTLEITGMVDGTARVAIGKTNTADTAFTTPPQMNHTYISALQSTGQSFELLPYENLRGEIAKFVRGSDGTWTVLLEPAGESEAKIRSFQFAAPETLLESIAEYAFMGLSVEYGAGGKPVDIESIPYEITVNGVPAKHDGAGTYTADGITEMYVTDAPELSVGVTENDKRYDIEITVPGTYTETGVSIKTSAALIVGNPPAPPDPPSHTHNWGSAWEKNETHHWHACTAEGCDLVRPGQMDGYDTHTAGDWITDTEPTETEEGLQVRLCAVCRYKMDQAPIPPTGGGTEQPDPPSHTHVWDTKWTSNDTHHWHECAAGGCGVTDNSQKGGYAAHTAGAWVVDKPATATQSGTKHRSCTVCGYVVERGTISATGGGSSSGGSSSGGSSSGSSSTTTSKGPGGSTVTTTTNRVTGTVTETTKWPNGSKLVLETKKDGTVTSTETAADGSVTKTVSDPSGSSAVSVKLANGTTAQVSTDHRGKSIAEVALSASAQSGGGAVALPIPNMPAARGSSSTVTVHTNRPQPVRVEIPTANPAPGVVAVLVGAGGTETVIKTSLPTPDGIVAAVPDGATIKLVDNSRDFLDTNGHWAKDAVSFVSSRELFLGTGTDTFGPEETMTRAMSMTILARLSGADTSGGSVWYQAGMDWAVAQGISDGKNPNATLTREQFVSMLYRYMGSPAATNKELRFSDADTVSGYARDAMCWGVENGILQGHGNGALAPGGETTRAQVAVMFKNFITLLNR